MFTLVLWVFSPFMWKSYVHSTFYRLERASCSHITQLHIKFYEKKEKKIEAEKEKLQWKHLSNEGISPWCLAW